MRSSKELFFFIFEDNAWKKKKKPHSSTEINTPSFKPGPRVASSGRYTKDMTPLHSSVVAQNIFPMSEVFQ